LHKAFKAIDAVDERRDGVAHRGEQLAGVGLAESFAADVTRAHGALTGQEPRAADAESTAEASQKVDAWRLPLHVSSDGLWVGAGELRELAVCALASHSGEPLVQRPVFHGPQHGEEIGPVQPATKGFRSFASRLVPR